MSTNALAKPMGNLERVLIGGDLSKLTEQERLEYYKLTCESLGLNPLTKPFDYIELNGKLVLYAKRDCTDQLRKVHGISVKIVSREVVDGIYVVTSQARTPDGREDESVGAVPIVKEGGAWKSSQGGKRFFEGNGEYLPLKPEDRANAIMKAETKSKRRVTLSICGLGMLDESELDTISEVRERQASAQNAVRDRKLAEIEAPAQLPAELEVLFSPDAPAKAITTAFEMCRRELLDALPDNGEAEYHRLLEFNGIHKGQSASLAAKRRCVAQMWTTAQGLKRMKERAKPQPAAEMGPEKFGQPEEWIEDEPLP